MIQTIPDVITAIAPPKLCPVTHGTLDWQTPLGRHKVVQIHFLTKNGPLEVIEDQILKKNYGPKSADRTADFGKISFFQFLTYVVNLRCLGEYFMTF